MRHNRLSDALRPTFVSPPLQHVSPDAFLDALPAHTKVISLDIDGTIAGQFDREPHPAVTRCLRRFVSAGLILAINSNAGEVRTERALHYGSYIGEHTGSTVPVVTTHMVGGHWKPRRRSFHEIAEVTGVAPRDICHVGDQDFKDVFGANRSGYGASVLVTPALGAVDNIAVRHLQRPLETRLLDTIGTRILPFGELVEFVPFTDYELPFENERQAA